MSDALRATAKLPGIERKDLHTTVENGTLVLRSEIEIRRGSVARATSEARPLREKSFTVSQAWKSRRFACGRPR